MLTLSPMCGIAPNHKALPYHLDPSCGFCASASSEMHDDENKAT